MINPLLKKKKKKEEPKTNNFNEMISPENNQDPFLKFGKSENPPIMTPATPTKTDKEKAFWSTPTNEKIKAGDNTIQNQFDIQSAKSKGMGGAEALQIKQEQVVRAQRLQGLLSQGQITEQELAALEQAPIDWGQALTAGAVNAAPSAITAAAGGLLAASGGLAATGIGAPAAVGTLAGAGALYAVAKLWGGVTSNIKAQQRGEIQAANKVLTNAKSNLRQLRMVVEQDPSRADEAIGIYQTQMNEVYRAQRKLKLETNGNLNKFMEDGTQDLAEFDLFLSPGGYADIQRMRLEQALARNAPATPEELMAVYNEVYGDMEQ